MNSVPKKRKFLLLEECFGKKITEDSRFGPSYSKCIPDTEVQLVPGSLLQEVKQDDSASQLCVRSLDHDGVYMLCEDSDVHELTAFEAEVLVPVSPVRDRLRVLYDNNWLQEAMLITEGSNVSVDLGADLDPVEGIVRYCGIVPELGKGIVYGIELLVHPEHGVCDGIINGKRYFQTPSKNAVFVGINRLRLHLRSGHHHHTRHHSTRSHQKRIASSGSVNNSCDMLDHHPEVTNRIGSGATLAPSKPHPISLEAACADGTPPPPLEIGDRVVWISDTGPEHGIVKWLGKLLDVGPDWMVGVEFDNPVGTGTGKYNDHQLFEAELRHASLVPIIGLIKADDFFGEKCFESAFGMPPKPARKKKVSEMASVFADRVALTEENPITVSSKAKLIKYSPIVSRKLSVSLVNDSKEEISRSLPPASSPDLLTSYIHLDNLDSCSGSSVNPLYEMLTEKTISGIQKLGITKLDDTSETMAAVSAPKKSIVPTSAGHRDSYIDGDLEVGSVVEVLVNGTPCYGVIKWIGEIPEARGKLVAGIELEEENSSCTDGTFNGKRYFSCPPHRAFFVRLSHCHRDSRFLDFERRKSAVFGSIDCPSVTGDIPPLSSPEDMKLLYGKNKGIQGHHNSCYLDATLFAMFSCTSVFDLLLHRPRNDRDIAEYDEVQRILKEEIVNPLRANFYVRADRVMELRKKLERLSSVRGLTCEEKDPEEFLNSLLNQILRADPFLKLSSGQESYFYQLFVEKDEKLVLPTVQQLFDQSFLASDIKLSEIPPCLLIQMPRFGKQFKMYPRILPSQYLDITDVLDDSPRQCSICGQVAEYECKECFGQFGEGLDSIAFCQKCLDKSHSHKKRSKHKSVKLSIPAEFRMLKDHTTVPRIYMELFAVVCIETSHYVCFVKCGSGPDAPWCFFDSMADRKGEQNGYNIPEVVPFQDLRWWLSDEGTQFLLSAKEDKMLPEITRRLLCDAYMCMYQSPDIMMYH